MKKLVVIFALCAFAFALFADAKEEALSSCDTAKDFIKASDFQKAADELNYALSKVNEILAGTVVNYLPQAPNGYTETSREASSLGSGGAMIGSANSLIATADYEAESGASLNATITVGGAMGAVADMASLGRMFGGATSGTESVRIKGYTGTLEYEKSDNSGTLTLKVDDGISVVINGDGIESGDILKELAKSMDLAGLEENF